MLRSTNITFLSCMEQCAIRALAFGVLLSLIPVAAIGRPASPNAVPQVNQPLIPTVVAPGGAAFTLTVNGTGFASTATVNWNGSPRTTTFVSAGQLTATINASDIAVAGTASVTVVNAAPGGGTSNVVYFPITTSSGSSLNFANVPGSPFALGTNPLYVALGDFNGDGKLDVAVAIYTCVFGPPCTTPGVVSIFLGNGDGTFQPPVNYATGNGPDTLAVGDFNGDGKLDLAASNGGSNSVSILLGNGDGTFQPHVDYPVSGGPGWVAAGDFNGDGKLDLAVTESTNHVDILLGNGDGTFQPAVNYATGNGPNDVIAGDFNGDGRLDLALSNYSDGTVSILLGNGDGTFQSHVDYAVGTTPDGVLIGDFNSDGKLDLVVANGGTNAVSILLGNGDGTFQPHVDFATGLIPQLFAVGDFNGDGNLDVAVTNANSNTISILLGNGNGTFQPKVDFPTGLGPNGAAAGDFNGDGRLDLAVVNISSNNLSILLQEPVASLAPPSLNFGNQTVGTTSSGQVATLSNTGSAPLTLTAFGISGANAADFAQNNTCGALPATLLPGGSCSFNVTFTPSAVGSRAASLDVTDNSNGIPGSVESVSLAGTGIGPLITLAPVNLNFTDLQVGTTSSAQTVIVTNPGNAPLNIASIALAGSDFALVNNTCPASLAASAMCTFGVTFTPSAIGIRTGTVAITDNVPPGMQIINLYGVGRGPENPLPFLDQPLNPTAATPGGGAFTLTVNGGGFISGSVVQWNGSALATTFMNKGQLTASVPAANIAAAGTASVTVVNPSPGGGASNVEYFTITTPTASIGTGRTPVTDIAVQEDPVAVVAGDFNGDGIPDLAVVNNCGTSSSCGEDAPTGSVSILLGNGDGTFTLKTTLTTGYYPEGAAVGDFNGDGKLDLAVVDRCSDPNCRQAGVVSIFLGNGDGTFTTRVPARHWL